MGRRQTVQDNSAQVAQIQAAAEEKARADALAQKQAEQAAFEKQLNAAFGSAMSTAKGYFSSMGLDPNNYLAQITDALNAKKSAVPQGDQSPGTYFANAGQGIYNDLQTAERAKAGKSIDKFAGTGFDTRLIADTADDSFIQSLLDSNYSDSLSKIDALKARGVFTDIGYGEAAKELSRQKAGAKNNLDSIGMAVLEGGRSNLRNTASEARTAASNLNLGDVFNPGTYETGINDKVAQFFAGLGDQIRGSVPEDLFDLTKAYGKGGIGQGIQNTTYDPEAAAGLFSEYDPQAEAAKKKKQPEFSPF